MGNSRPPWDAARAAALIGQYILVGIRYTEADGETTTSEEQFHGYIARVDWQAGVEIACEGHRKGETKRLPPDLSAIEKAEPGEYRLKTTGEVVVNPDLTSTWRFSKAPKVSINKR